jgi:hypothetical protein
MASGGEEEGDVRVVLLGYDALADDAPGARRLLVFDSPPAPGDLVLVIEEGVARVVRFEERTAPRRPAWLVGVVRQLADPG